MPLKSPPFTPSSSSPPFATKLAMASWRAATEIPPTRGRCLQRRSRLKACYLKKPACFSRLCLL